MRQTGKGCHFISPVKLSSCYSLGHLSKHVNVAKEHTPRPLGTWTKAPWPWRFGVKSKAAGVRPACRLEPATLYKEPTSESHRQSPGLGPRCVCGGETHCSTWSAGGGASPHSQCGDLHLNPCGWPCRRRGSWARQGVAWSAPPPASGLSRAGSVIAARRNRPPGGAHPPVRGWAPSSPFCSSLRGGLGREWERPRIVL